ncbi:glyoxylase-like metal-dependent hydrolase (beta-lactamase superfamily II) [Bacillus tianshenii]|uniref:Glyoxylase-like metal-dependent hydrolase (Beta-lactamase superfamily II) n=1 Tax=Sutcliffiella tianshenii TaxID=1463404 RepID=A0ABS2P341_9BACI|nr:MBL fold metallo-hydrolase [Bacillus tianshenii]MBM7621374.1 glyoxylase-like metal-dependent hydrolase (beta-lactamase superfamily II) [Bacillus tianshenii]
MEAISFGQWKLTWLNGGVTHLDGGAMFGVVPKALWSRKYPVNEQNQIELRTDPILLQTGDKNILIDAGIGNGKLSDKQKRNFGVLEESSIEKDLETLGLATEDIDMVLMTHLHFDHVCGLNRWDAEKEEYVSLYPNASIHVSSIEWEEMKNPNIRSRNTYWEMNWQGIEEQIRPFEKEVTLEQGIKMIHTGGHSDGHSIIELVQGNEVLLHMADLMPTHAHSPSLWVLAYDDYPMTSIYAKEKWIKEGIARNAWFTFYHDAIYRAVKWNKDFEISDKVEREK